ncbi:globin domain-containing protein [Shouchella sp. 1P09AA]|uniref:globin domain-containing protein n=1 Tax=unclassified Shouchella TaxID=2893065 RepID=UPI0039A232C8
MLSQTTINTIKATVPVLEEHGLTITTRFYELLFSNHPELWNVFNHANQARFTQQEALAKALHAAASHIEQLGNIAPAVEKIAHKHRSIGVKAEHYPIVGHFLIVAMKDVLGEGANKEVIRAWEDVYGILSQQFIEIESALEKEANWSGFLPLKVTKIIRETSDMTSFYLQAENRTFLPGQYVSVKVHVNGYDHIRQYSLSNENDQRAYRISVKREQPADGPNGIVSQYMHHHVNVGDALYVSAPAGTVRYHQEIETPLVFISAGSGVTPMISMLKSVTTDQPKREVHFVYGTTDSTTHVFKEEVEDIVQTHPEVKQHIFYTSPLKTDTYTRKSKINQEAVSEIISPLSDPEIMIGGSKPFIHDVYTSLKACGVEDRQIRYESFEPQI